MPASRDAWAAAFAAQSRSDWQVYNRLAAEPDIPVCHQLHYLQMACEKIGKAYRCLDRSTHLDELLKRHIGFAKFIGSYLASPSVKEAYRGRAAQLQEVSRLARALAREIEKLAPAVDRAGTPENAEYPWEVGGEVVAPCNYQYPRLSLLTRPGGRVFLKLIGRALQELEDTGTSKLLGGQAPSPRSQILIVTEVMASATPKSWT